MKKQLFAVLVALGLYLGLSLPALADGMIVPMPRPSQPAPPLRSLAIKYHRVSVTIQDQVATTRVDQVFVNESGYEMEGEYIFPLPEEASISRFTMWVDGKPLEAEVLPRDKARQIYEDIVRRQRDPALLEYVGRNAFRARIYPIPARGEKRIEIEYSEVLAWDRGLVRYVYPLNTEKFSSRPLEEVVVVVRVNSRQPLKALYSPSHEIVVHRSNNGLAAEASYSARNTRPDKDFVLYYTTSQDDLSVNLLSFKERDKDGFFLLLLAPGSQVKEEEIVAKDVLFVLDTSGSMRGKKLEQAKRAARYVLDGLNEQDRFNIIAFSTSTSHFERGLRPTLELRAARAFVDNLQAEGSTNLSRAMSEALAQTAKDRPQVIILLTDGLPTEGEVRIEKIIEQVANKAGSNVRIFAFGVGYDVNTTLLDTISQAHHGTSAYVRPEEDIERVVSSFYDKISKPVLTDVSLDLGKARSEDVYPDPLPDIFVGGQIVVVGRYRHGGPTSVTLRGKAHGEPVTYTFPNLELRESGGADFIPRLWATRKIGHLLTQIRLRGSNAELVDEIVALSVRYGIVTPYTSFLINENEDALTDAGRRSVVQREVAPQAQLAMPGRGGAAAPAPTAAASGPKAVEKSIAQEALRQADVAAAPQTEQVRIVGDRAFVLRQEVWIDTTFDASKMKAEPVVLGSEHYFELLRSHPDWGRYLALGPQVVLVWEGRAYHLGAVSENGAGREPTPAVPSPLPSSSPRTVTPSESTPLPQGQGDVPMPTPTPSPSLWERLGIWWRQAFPH